MILLFNENVTEVSEVKMDNTKQVVCIRNYRPASLLALLPALVRITSYLTSFYNFRKLKNVIKDNSFTKKGR